MGITLDVDARARERERERRESLGGNEDLEGRKGASVFHQSFSLKHRERELFGKRRRAFWKEKNTNFFFFGFLFFISIFQIPFV